MLLQGRIYNYKRGSRTFLADFIVAMAADLQLEGGVIGSLYVQNDLSATLTLANTLTADFQNVIDMQAAVSSAFTVSPTLLIRADLLATLLSSLTVATSLTGGTPAPPLETHGNFKRFSARSGPAVKAATPRRDVSEISTGEIVVQDKPSYDDLLGHNLYIKKRA